MTAFWLLETFGGRIILLKQNSGYMIKNPDYKWNDKFWELKGIQSSVSLDTGIRKSIKQILNKPGGIIIDLSNYKDKLSGIYGIIARRMQLFGTSHGYIILKKKKKLLGIYKY